MTPNLRNAISRITDAVVALDTADGEARFAVEEGDELAISNAIDYMDEAESAVMDARDYLLDIQTEMEHAADIAATNVVMRDLEGHGNLAGR